MLHAACRNTSDDDVREHYFQKHGAPNIRGHAPSLFVTDASDHGSGYGRVTPGARNTRKAVFEPFILCANFLAFVVVFLPGITISTGWLLANNRPIMFAILNALYLVVIVVPLLIGYKRLKHEPDRFKGYWLFRMTLLFMVLHFLGVFGFAIALKK